MKCTVILLYGGGISTATTFTLLTFLLQRRVTVTQNHLMNIVYQMFLCIRPMSVKSCYCAVVKGSETQEKDAGASERRADRTIKV